MPAPFVELPTFIRGFTLEFQSGDSFETSDARKLDPDWKFVDQAGHGHFVESGKVPTLEWVSEPCTMGHGDDCTSEGAHQCRICGEVIEPGTVAVGLVRVPGPSTYLATLESEGYRAKYRFNDVDMGRLRDAVRATIEEVLEYRMYETERWA